MASLPPRIVLVVDDNIAVGENLREILEMEGYACWLARSADAGLRRLELELRSPDVILLDLLMPGMVRCSSRMSAEPARLHRRWPCSRRTERGSARGAYTPALS